MFSLKEFIKKGLIDGVGKLPDYQIIINASGWYEKGVLALEDLEEINQAIEESNVIPEPIEEQPEEPAIEEEGEE